MSKLREFIESELQVQFPQEKLTTFQDGDKEITTIPPQLFIDLYNDVFGYGCARLEVLRREKNLNKVGVCYSVDVTSRLIISCGVFQYVSPEVTKGWPVTNGDVGQAFNAAESLCWPATGRFLGIGKELYVGEAIAAKAPALKVVGREPVDSGAQIDQAATDALQKEKETTGKEEKPKSEKQEKTPPGDATPPPAEKKEEYPESKEKVDPRMAKFDEIKDLEEKKKYVYETCSVSEETFKERTGEEGKPTKRVTEKKLRLYLQEWLDGKWEEVPPVPEFNFGKTDGQESEEDDNTPTDLGPDPLPEEGPNPFGSENVWENYLLTEQITSMEIGRDNFMVAKDMGQKNYEDGFMQYVAQKLNVGVADIPKPLQNFLTYAQWCTAEWIALIEEFKGTLE